MPISINGSGTVTGVSVGGLPDGIVDTEMLAAGAVTAAKKGAGSVLQVKYAKMGSSDFSYASGTETDITGLSVDITKSSASNKILVLCAITPYVGGSGGTGHYRLKCLRDSTTIHNNNFGFMRETDTHKSAGPVMLLLDDGANDTSSHTYKMRVQGVDAGRQWYIFTNSGANINGLMCMEIAA